MNFSNQTIWRICCWFVGIGFLQTIPLLSTQACTQILWSIDAKDLVISNSAGPGKGWQYIKNFVESGKPVTESALYYGSPSAGNYSFGENNGTAITPTIYIPAAGVSKLKMNFWMQVESGGYDMFKTVAIQSVSTPAITKVLFSKPRNFLMKKWFPIELDLTAFAGTEIQILFSFDTGDGNSNTGRGVYVSDYQILSGCP